MTDSIGIALSGGGFRAAAFHLGVLKRLDELGVLSQTARISTVSGGSVTGALYALKCVQHGSGVPGTYSVEALISDIRPILTGDFRRKALLGDWKRKIRTFASYGTGLVNRVSLVSKTLDDELFGGAMLCEVPPWLLINATNVLTGKCWKFFHDRAGDYLIGATDKTDSILLSDAVTASAAFPIFVDALPFKTRWQDLSGDLLDHRWQKPPAEGSGNFSRWRSKFGQTTGNVTIPLVDGGLYDNEGLNGLRSSRVSFAIYASTAPPEASHESMLRLRGLRRLVDIMHGRLGALTRQLAHEMTHGTHPSDVRGRLLELSEQIRNWDAPDAAQVAEELIQLASVGWPPRGVQYRATAPIVLHRTDLAQNKFASFDPPLKVPPEHRGLNPGLVDALSRVRTDLDSFDSYLIDLLIAQAYFLTDAHVRLAMPELVPSPVPPMWDWAIKKTSEANANESNMCDRLKKESSIKILLKR